MRHVMTAILTAILISCASARADAACVSYSTFTRAVGEITTGHAGADLAISGMYAYAALAPSEVAVFSLADPTEPALVAGLTLGEPPVRLKIAGNRLYAVAQHHMYIIDITHPASPTLLGTLPVGGDDAEPAGSLVYLVGSGLRVVDVSNPAAPTVITTYTQFQGGATGIARKGNYLYIGDALGIKTTSVLQVVGILDPIHPVPVFTVDDASLSASGRPWRLGTDGNRLVVSAAGLSLFDISNPAHPVWNNDTLGSDGAAFALSGGVLIAADYSRLYLVQLVGLDLHVTGLLNLDPGSYGLARSGPYLYVLQGGNDSTGVLSVFDVTDPHLPPSYGQVNTPGQSGGGAINGTHAFVADGHWGLQVVSLADEQHPLIVGSFNTPGYLNDVEVSGSFGYGADEANGLTLFDLSNPTAPALASTVSTPGVARRVGMSGVHALVACEEGGLAVVDVTNPTAPLLVATIGTADLAHDVAVLGDHAFVVGGPAIAGGAGYLQSFDISTPGSPIARGLTSLPRAANALVIQGGNAYIVCGAQGSGSLEVVDLSDPELPSVALSIPLEMSPRAVAAENGMVFVGGEVVDIWGTHARVAVLDARAWPDAPTHIADLSLINEADPVHGLALGGGYLAALGGNGSLRLFAGECPGAASIESGSELDRRLALSPNPTATSSTLRCSLPDAGPVRISIFDVGGRLVRETRYAHAAAGPLAWLWDGRDEAGRLVPSGIYRARIASSKEVLARGSIVRLR